MTNLRSAEGLWYVGQGRAELRREVLPHIRAGEILVRALYSGVSRGTESLVFSGRVPPSEYERMRSPHMGGAFPFPVKHGYALVARVEDGSQELAGKTVFALHPHQDLAAIDASSCVLVPDNVPLRRAVLGANMETALNAVWDAGVLPGMRVAVVGAGVIGCLVARICARYPEVDVTLIDVDPERARVTEKLNAKFALPPQAPSECDVVFHASGKGEGLATALGCAGKEASIIELSWYGADNVPAPLGGAFHSKRLRIISSQVGEVAPAMRARQNYRNRLQAALRLLADDALDCLLAPSIAFKDAPGRMPDILSPGSRVLCQVIEYPAARQ
jgi:NADPH:quinone reductase-like Zn-dependent oxidoreductase